jgi:hypothetical protein
VIVALDGLAPQGGEPHMWFIRALSTGLTLRSGWLAQLDQPTFEAFLPPLKHLEWPMLAVLSDKQTGLVPAIATILPHSRHQCCQAPYLRNLAEPLAKADAAFKGELRKTVREQVGALLRQDARRSPGHVGVLTVTGLLPSPVEEPTGPACQRPPPAVSPLVSAPEAEQVLTQLVRHTRYLLTLKGRPPFRLAGIETYERLHSVACVSLDLLAQRYDPRLAPLYQGLQSALAPFAATSHALHHGAAWLRDIASILAPVPTSPLSAADIAGQLRRYLDTVQRQPAVTPTLATFGRHLDTVSQSSWPGLFHCDEMAGLPRTNNALGQPLSRDAPPPAADQRPAGAHAADTATPRRLGTPAPPPDRSHGTGGIRSNPIRGLGTGAAALCRASPAFPLAESVPSTNPGAIRSPASAVVSTTAYRHRVTFALLRTNPVGKICSKKRWIKACANKVRVWSCSPWWRLREVKRTCPARISPRR